MSLKRFGKAAKPDIVTIPPVSGMPSSEETEKRIPMTVRLSREQWRRVKGLAIDEETSVQDLAVRGISRLLEEKGLEPL